MNNKNRKLKKKYIYFFMEGSKNCSEDKYIKEYYGQFQDKAVDIGFRFISCGDGSWKNIEKEINKEKRSIIDENIEIWCVLDKDKNDLDKINIKIGECSQKNYENILTRKLNKKYKKSEGIKFTLDDKELIKEFDKVNLTPEFVKDFAYNLLLAKYFLDNFVIHHTNGEDRAIENPWKLQYFYKKGSKAAYLKDLYEDNKAQQNEVIQLLSMFEVAFTPKQRKNYLFYCLYHLFEDCDLNNYVEFLRKLADKYFFDVYLDASKLNDINQPKPNSSDETIFNNGELNIELEEVK